MPSTLKVWKDLTASTLANRITEIHTGKVNSTKQAQPKPSVTTMIYEQLSEVEIKALPMRETKYARGKGKRKYSAA